MATLHVGLRSFRSPPRLTSLDLQARQEFLPRLVLQKYPSGNMDTLRCALALTSAACTVAVELM